MVEGSGGGGPELGPGSKPTSFEAAGGRLRFTVELRPGETTIVSWKKLLKEANSSKSNRPGPSISGQSFEAQRQPVAQPPPPPPPLAPSSSKQPTEAEPKDSQAQAGSNRLSTVIERIERMYAGNGSSDEEDVVLDNIPDDDEYDTEDSFIDDTELDDYFQVDNLAIKHDGFFVNRGKLEPIEPTICTNQQPKKRRRKDLMKGHGGSDDGHNPNKIVKVGNRGRKRNSTSESHGVSMPNIHVRPPSTEVQDPDISSQAVKRRLPAEIKQKLGKIARLARNLKVMANMGLSAKQEKDDRIQKIKQEVAEMVKLRIPYMKSKDRDKIKKKKVLAPKAEDAMNVTQAHIHEKKLSGPRDQVSALTSKHILSAAMGQGAGLLPVAFANGSNIDKLKQAKKNGSSSKGPIPAMPSGVLPKKKVKRKPNAEANEAQFSLEKLVSQGEERRKHPKHVALPLTKSNLQPPSGSAYQT
ncbi:UNVERIFIED_CONTAM: Ubinuclein-1 [Sesamum radiatum]|uniref:Ubinuclein-1 n=1 Tax=Sesamum radiatum TaxID=300843 RepID=A0AAW2QED1_SESRA